MTGWDIFVLAALFVIACTAIGYVCFAAGWRVGWDERHSTMVLPESSLQRITDNEVRWRT